MTSGLKIGHRESLQLYVTCSSGFHSLVLSHIAQGWRTDTWNDSSICNENLLDKPTIYIHIQRLCCIYTNMNDDKLMSTIQGSDWFILLSQGIEPYGWIRICTRLHTDAICFRHYLFYCTQLSLLSPATWGPKRSISPHK